MYNKKINQQKYAEKILIESINDFMSKEFFFKEIQLETLFRNVELFWSL